MKADFWHNKWENKEIGFHHPEANPLLTQHFSYLNLSPGSRIFIPLCGKTLDIAWLLAQGMRVVGAELSQIAIDELFTELAVTPTITPVGEHLHYHADGIDVYVGDIFSLQQGTLGQIDAVYDRAALVALPESMREQYTAQIVALTGAAAQLLITFEYDQQRMPGPPFSVVNDEVYAHYHSVYDIQSVYFAPLEGGLKGKVPAQERVSILTKTPS